LTGAGSGGHITPLLAVAAELKKRQQDVQLVYIGQRGDKLGDIPAGNPNIDQAFSVRAGKFRRYHGEGLKQLLDLKTMALNIRDIFYVLAGLVQSWRLLRQLQPDVIFVKGGFVGVPVGLAAAALGIPFVTHDSDAIPGLANRIIARWAARHAVALPEEVYDYPIDLTITTGIPVQKEFKPVTDELKKKYRKELGIAGSSRVLFIIGGGLGSQTVNRGVADIVPHLLSEWPDLHVVHIAGRANETEMGELYASLLTETQQKRVWVYGYLNDVYRYSGAADIVVTRAGATNLAEFALQGKACIVVPSPFLTGGHQLKNARYLEDKHAALVLDERELKEDANRLAKQVSQLLANSNEREALGKALTAFGHPDATQKLAELLLATAAKTPSGDEA
jgi:UDP-N-acetylglucosamine--N-acetylmuramyl-(pentapeptide) pyrophosphoryl-undecaprenol N-acetylglucosamine transferase